MYTIADLRGLTITNLQKELEQTRRELTGHRIKIRLGQDRTNDRVSKLRRQNARILMVLREKASEPAAQQSK